MFLREIPPPKSPIMQEAIKASGLPLAQARRRLRELKQAAVSADEQHAIAMLTEGLAMGEIAEQERHRQKLSQKRARRGRP